MFLLSLFHFPGAVKCSLPFCMALHVTVSLVLSLVLLSCPLFSIGLCALLKVKANPEFSQTCSFLGLTECKTSGGGGESLACIIPIASMLWWVCFSLAETMLYRNSKLKSPMWNLLGVTHILPAVVPKTICVKHAITSLSL